MCLQVFISCGFAATSTARIWGHRKNVGLHAGAYLNRGGTAQPRGRADRAWRGRALGCNWAADRWGASLNFSVIASESAVLSENMARRVSDVDSPVSQSYVSEMTEDKESQGDEKGDSGQQVEVAIC